MRRDDRLRKALRGGFGYAEQKRAWDAVFPDWRRGIKLIGKGRLSDISRKRFMEWAEIWQRANLEETHPIAWRAWGELLMQARYRSCPALGGWFPK